jgi:multidrug efflux pump subunit AcrA (membrane-fusion protein)
MQRPNSSRKMSTKSPAGQSAPKAFIQAFRRRSLLVSFLGLCYLAALVNEGVRWLAIGLNVWLGADLPVFSVGPFFLVLAFLYALRRWSLTAAAEKADRALDFRDRLTSLADFEGRRDVPASMARAQSEETAAALTGISPARVRPVPVLLCAGPLVLTLSAFYPNLMTLLPPRFQVAQYSSDVRHRLVDPEQPGSSGEWSEADRDSRPAAGDEAPGTSPEKDTGRDADGQRALQSR